jgi:sodium/bile acid cotransporter 7
MWRGVRQLYGWIKKYWFLAGLIAIFVITLADITGTISGMGEWFKVHHGPAVAVILIFFFSGLLLETDQIKSGLKDIKGTLIALSIVFLISPLTAFLSGQLPLDTGVKIGIFLVAVMPTTLSSGVVMTGAAGGNMAHALVITILSSGLAVFSIPLVLSFLLNLVSGKTDISFDKTAMMLKITGLVILPLGIGLAAKYYTKIFSQKLDAILQVLNQCLIISIVWMALSPARAAILNSGEIIGWISAGTRAKGECDFYGWSKNAAPFGHITSIAFSTIRSGAGGLCGTPYRSPADGRLFGGTVEGIAHGEQGSSLRASIMSRK